MHPNKPKFLNYCLVPPLCLGLCLYLGLGLCLVLGYQWFHFAHFLQHLCSFLILKHKIQKKKFIVWFNSTIFIKFVLKLTNATENWKQFWRKWPLTLHCIQHVNRPFQIILQIRSNSNRSTDFLQSHSSMPWLSNEKLMPQPYFIFLFWYYKLQVRYIVLAIYHTCDLQLLQNACAI